MKCKNCGKEELEHIDNIWCYKGFGSCGSSDWQKFVKMDTEVKK